MEWILVIALFGWAGITADVLFGTVGLVIVMAIAFVFAFVISGGSSTATQYDPDEEMLNAKFEGD